jgi:hypothetical protein
MPRNPSAIVSLAFPRSLKRPAPSPTPASMPSSLGRNCPALGQYFPPPSFHLIQVSVWLVQKVDYIKTLQPRTNQTKP